MTKLVKIVLGYYMTFATFNYLFVSSRYFRNLCLQKANNMMWSAPTFKVGSYTNKKSHITLNLYFVQHSDCMSDMCQNITWFLAV